MNVDVAGCEPGHSISCIRQNVCFKNTHPPNYRTTQPTNQSLHSTGASSSSLSLFFRGDALKESKKTKRKIRDPSSWQEKNQLSPVIDSSYSEDWHSASDAREGFCMFWKGPGISNRCYPVSSEFRKEYLASAKFRIEILTLKFIMDVAKYR